MSRSDKQRLIPRSLISEIRQGGFEGGIYIRELQRTCRREGLASFPVPRIPGVYLVVREDRRAPRFLRRSRGGPFNGRDPTLPVAALRAQWVPGAAILYVGKAGGTNQRATLHSRLICYMRFGLGLPTAHWGGRCIWQLADAGALQIYWKAAPSAQPRANEKHLIAAFVERYGRRPFANLTG